MLTIERILAAAAVFVAAHFAMGFINSSAGGSGGSLLFPFATDAPTRWAFGSLDGMLGLLSPVMIGLAGIAVLTFFVAFFSSLGLWVPLVGAGVVGGIVLMAAAGDQTAVPLALSPATSSIPPSRSESPGRFPGAPWRSTCPARSSWGSCLP